MLYLDFLDVSSNDPATPEIYTLSLHDALPISQLLGLGLSQVLGSIVAIAAVALLAGFDMRVALIAGMALSLSSTRSEEHTSELQSRRDLVCRLLLEKKKKISKSIIYASFPVLY